MSKKKYICPDVYCESFILSQHIASCGLVMNATTEQNCTVTITDEMAKEDIFFDGCVGKRLFLTADMGCNVTDDSYCYTNSTNVNLLFGS